MYVVRLQLLLAMGRTLVHLRLEAGGLKELQRTVATEEVGRDGGSGRAGG